MTREQLTGKHGYAVPCLHTLTGEETTVCLAAHGFGSSKSGPMYARLAEELPRRGIGFLALDFPAHGESPAGAEDLTVEHCLDDLAAAEARARALCPGAALVYFGSSFGAYCLLLYLGSRPHGGRRAFLRSAAVEMPAIYRGFLESDPERLDRLGGVVIAEGYARPMRLTPAFAADLAAHDVFACYRPGTADLAMVHGGRDQVASPEAARRFAAWAGAALTLLPDGAHDLSGPGMPEKVVDLAADFFLGR